MNLLITAGAAGTALDATRLVVPAAVPRVIARVAAFAYTRGHSLTILTSTPDVLAELPDQASEPHRLTVVGFQTADDLLSLLPQCAASVNPDAVLHAAALPEFTTAGVFVPTPGTVFQPRGRTWENPTGPPAFADAHPAGAVVDAEQWVRLVRAPRLIDRLKSQWKFAGPLVLFRVDPDTTDHQLLEIAEAHRTRANADMAVTATASGEPLWAFVGPQQGRYHRTPRRELAERVVLFLEDAHRERVSNG